MADQSDLQKWLNELKKRSGSPQGSGAAGRRYQPAPPPREQPPTARPEAPRPLNMVEYLDRTTQEESADEVDFTRAVSIKEQRRRKQEELRLKEGRRQQRQARAAEGIRKQRQQILKEEEAAEQKRDVNRARLKVEAAAQGKPSRGKPSNDKPDQGKSVFGKRPRRSTASARGMKLKNLHYYLGKNRTVLREAVILAEILGKPKSLHHQEGLWDQ